MRHRDQANGDLAPTTSSELFAGRRLGRLEEGVLVPVENSTRGATGRIWTARQFKIRLPWSPESARQHIPSAMADEYRLAKMACEFARDHAPALYARWHECMLPAAAAWREERANPSQDGYNALVETEPRKRDECASTWVGQQLRGTLTDASGGDFGPIEFRVPALRPGHWLRDRHTAPGQNQQDATREEIEFEGKSDAKSVRERLEAYHALARDVQGKTLFLSTKEPQARDPFYSCMELCICELQLPAHFLALIHCGLGLNFALDGRVRNWERRGGESMKKHPEGFALTKELFDEVARMWREDFPGCVTG